MATRIGEVGEHLRDWRMRRRMSQLDLAAEAEISTRHLSFVETGRSRPSRDMLLRLADGLEMPLRERNRLLLAGGFAPLHPERDLSDPDMAPARAAIDRLLAAHSPFPALAIDRRWNLVAANDAVAPLLAGAAGALLAPPVNVLRLSLHPDGLAPRILNLGEWRAHILHRLAHQQRASADPGLAALAEELAAYPGRAAASPPRLAGPLDGLLVPLRLATPAGALSLISTTTVFGTAQDVTLAEIALETFFPADSESEALLRRLAAG